MKSFFYVCELNLSHPKAPLKDASEDVRCVTFISRPFMDSEAAMKSIEHDIIERMSGEIKKGGVPVRVSEVNPFLVNTDEQLNERVVIDPRYADYLKTWEADLLGRMTIIDEMRESEGCEEVSYHNMPPHDYIMRYYLREYEDGIEVPAENSSFFVMHETVQ